MTNSNRVSFPGVCLLVALLGTVLPSLAPQLIAQVTTASITGFVRDQSNASVPRATVTATQEATGFSRSFVTREDGSFSLPALPMGTYTLTAEASGFKKYARTGFGPLGAGQVATLDIEMAVGAVMETVQVTGIAPLLQAQGSVVRTPVSQDQIQSLPMNSRNPVALMLLQPGAKISLQSGGNILGGAMGFNFNGQSQAGTTYLMDGTDASIVADPALTVTTGNLITAGIDSIAEIDLGTGNYTAEVKGSGGYVNVVSKTGTNKFHASLFEFWRNDILNARNFFAASRAGLRLNDFGATVTGPIQRDKTFFMGSWEAQRIRRPTVVHINVPTAAFRATVAPALKKFLDVTPLPTSDIAGNATVGWFDRAPVNEVRQDLVTGRIDHVFSARDSMFGRYTINDKTQWNHSAWPGFKRVYRDRHQYMTLSETHIFTANLLNTLKLGGDRFDERSILGNGDGEFLDSIGVPGMSIAGGETFIEYPHNGFSIADDVIWNKGKHTLKFGVLWQGILYGRTQLSAIGYTYATPAAFALNQPTSVSSYFGPGKLLGANHFSNFEQSLYIQDDFRVTPSLTLNLGLRYDNFGVQKESQGRALNVVRDPLGPFRDPKTPLYERNNKDFGPRIGFAWQPFGLNRIVIRSGFGLYWGGPGSLEQIINNQFNLIQGFGIARTDVPTLAYPINAAALTYIATSPGRWVVDPYAKDISSLQWSLGTEYQVSNSTTLRATYVGNHQVHIGGVDEPNLFDPLLGRRPNPTLGSVLVQTRQDGSSYNALQLSYQRRFARGLGLNGHYTWAHAIGLQSGPADLTTGIGLSGAPMIQSYKLRGASRGNLAIDQRHNLVMDVHYKIPFPNYSSRLVGKLFSGWGLAQIVTISSGFPFNIVTGRDAGNGRLLQRPNLVPGVNPIITGVDPVNGMLNPAAFAVPTAVNPTTGEILGNLGTNVLHGRRFYATDFALKKSTKVGERLNIEFRLEFFNLPNYPYFNNPVANLSVFNFRTPDIPLH